MRVQTGADEAFLDDVVRGLSASPKHLLCKYFYDKRGSELFDRICTLEEYYPTRTETAILEDCVNEIEQRICDAPVIFELGSGSSIKTQILLDRFARLKAYVPMDISARHLSDTAERLRTRYPDLAIHPVTADYNYPYTLPEPVRHEACVMAFFPGSTIGNFSPADAEAFLTRIYNALPDNGYLLIGVDLLKDRRTLERAYNDAQGVTAAFNRNLLERINSELGGNFPVDTFHHAALFNETESRIEMHLVADAPCRVTIGNYEFNFDANEAIHTEYSYKYSLEAFQGIARAARFRVQQIWTDADALFSVQLLQKTAVE